MLQFLKDFSKEVKIELQQGTPDTYEKIAFVPPCEVDHGLPTAGAEYLTFSSLIGLFYILLNSMADIMQIAPCDSSTISLFLLLLKKTLKIAHRKIWKNFASISLMILYVSACLSGTDFW
jgi:hypothetical protein